MRKFFWIFLVIAISFFSFNSLLRAGYIPMHDDMQPVRLLQLDKCLKDGQIPCRWVPDLGYGYGYPLFIFYSPLAYYVMEIIHLTGFSILTSIKIGFIFSFIFSGLTMFLFGKALWGKWGGLVSSAFYVYAPYRAADVYSRGAVGEFWALGFMPLILWAILNLIKNPPTKKNGLFLSLSITGLLLTHNLTFIAFAPVIVVWTLFLLHFYKKWNYIPKLVISVIPAFCLSAFYTLPLVFEKQYVHIDTMTSGYFNYLAHFVSLSQLFFRGHWGFGSSELGPFDDLSFSIGVIHWLILFISIILLIFNRKKIKNKLNFLVLFFFTGLFFGSIFLTHSKSTFIWQTLTFMKYFQFPWRFLILTILSTSVLAGFPIFLLKSNRKLSIVYASLLIFSVIFFNARLFRPSRYIDINDQQKFSGQNWEYQITASIYDYLPIFAKTPPAKPAPQSPQILDGDSQIVQFQKGTDWQKGKILTTSPSSTIQLPLFYYPGFKLWLNGQEIPFDYQNELGLITFQTSSGQNDFIVKMTKTPVRLTGDLLSLLGLLLLFILYV